MSEWRPLKNEHGIQMHIQPKTEWGRGLAAMPIFLEMLAFNSHLGASNGLLSSQQKISRLWDMKVLATIQDSSNWDLAESAIKPASHNPSQI